MSRLRHRRAFIGALISGGLLLPTLSPKRSSGEARQLVLDGKEWELEDDRVAGNDREKLPVELRNTVAYFTTSTETGEYVQSLGQVLCGIVPSLSHKTDLSNQIPRQLSDTVWRIDLLGLGWASVWGKVIREHYPYYSINVDRKKYVPQIIRADWFCADVFDEVETGDAQYQLLYSGAVPKNRTEFFNFWKVQNESEFVYGMIEGKSGVAVNGRGANGNSVRQIENRTTARRGYAWITKDSERIAGKTDPLANLHLLAEGTEFDASEYIVGIYKVHNGQSGCLQAYFLSDGNRVVNGKRQTGTRQAKAPVSIVEDTTNIRGREIRNSSSCIYCHTAGIIPPTQNEYRRYIQRDTQLKLDYKTKYELERYQGSDLEQEVKLNQQLYDSGIRACTGFSASEFSAAYRMVVEEYVRPIDLPKLARELAFYYQRGYLTSNELQLAIAFGSNKGILGARQAAIGEEDLLNRDMVINDYSKYQEVVQLWRKSH